MSHGVKTVIFGVCLLLGIFLQMGLGVHCRCAWGDWSSRFIEGAVALDLFIAAHVAYAVMRRRFYNDCLLVGALVLTSFLWIPLLYKGATAVYLLVNEGSIGQLGH